MPPQGRNKARMIASALEEMNHPKATTQWLLWMGTASMVGGNVIASTSNI